jgi:DNA-binding NarL/FixJ family response regulator
MEMQQQVFDLFKQGLSKKKIADSLKIDKKQVEKLLVQAMREGKK